MDKQGGAVIRAVAPSSPAERLGLRPGDRLLAVNGRPLRDFIDYLEAVDAEEVRLSVRRRDGRQVAFRLEKDPEAGLGVEFSDVVFDGVRRCQNRCAFCFVDQLPRGLRPSLSVKDDDYRLSFCQGNYITLTNLSASDVERILRSRLSPLYVSVHAMDPEVRARLLGNPRGGRPSLELLERLLAGGIEVHAQLVLCPGWNDGPVLEDTLERLGRFERVRSIAAVPVGLTQYRRGRVALRPFSVAEARAVLAVVHRRQAEFFARRGTRLVFAADEFYLRAGVPIPSAETYEDFSQLEDGVGLTRRLWDEVAEAVERLSGSLGRAAKEECHLVTGVAGAAVLHPVLVGLQRRGLGRRVRLLVVPNRFFGAEGITVTGLLTGRDVAAAVADARRRGEKVSRLVVPDVLFRSGRGVTLDDWTPEMLATRCGGVQVDVVPTDGEQLVRQMCGLVGEGGNTAP